DSDSSNGEEVGSPASLACCVGRAGLRGALPDSRALASSRSRSISSVTTSGLLSRPFRLLGRSCRRMSLADGRFSPSATTELSATGASGGTRRTELSSPFLRLLLEGDLLPSSRRTSLSGSPLPPSTTRRTSLSLAGLGPDLPASLPLEPFL